MNDNIEIFCTIGAAVAVLNYVFEGAPRSLLGRLVLVWVLLQIAWALR